MSAAAVFVCLLGATGVHLLVEANSGPRTGTRMVVPAIDGLTRRAGVANRSQLAGLVAASALSAAVAGAGARAATGVSALGVVVGAVATLVPLSLLRRHQRREADATRDAWPEAVDQLVSYIRSGESLPAAIAALGERGPVRLRERFASVSADYRATGDFTVALGRLGHSAGDQVASRVASALSLAHKVGGRELVRVLRALSDLVREDQLLRKEISARQSWTVSGARAAAAAPWVILALFATRPSTLAAFRSPAGNVLVTAGALATILGYKAMLFLGRVGAGGGAK